MRNFIFGILFLSILISCDAKYKLDLGQTPTPTPAPSSVPDIAKPAATATPKPVASATPAAGLAPKLAWETADPSRKAWSVQLDTLVKSYLPNFSKAADRASYCKNYDKLSDDNKALVWDTMFVEIIRYESGFKPTSAMTESNAAISQGLFQLTYGDSFCPKKKSEGDLNDVYVNLKCGLAIANNFVKNDGVIAAGGYVSQGAPAPKGLARYWSVIRVPDKKSQHKKSLIMASTNALAVCK